MSAAEILIEIEALGIELVADGPRLRVRPKSLLSLELIERLREHKDEILDRLTWPEKCLAAEQEHGHPCARLFPLVGGRVGTPMGQGRLIEALPERAVVILDRRPGRFTVLLPAEIGPPGATVQSETMRSLAH